MAGLDAWQSGLSRGFPQRAVGSWAALLLGAAHACGLRAQGSGRFLGVDHYGFHLMIVHRFAFTSKKRIGLGSIQIINGYSKQ